VLLIKLVVVLSEFKFKLFYLF